MSDARGTLRADMPKTAALIDQLRLTLGKEYVDALLLKAKQGRGGFYAAEVSPLSGELKEFGSTSRFGRGPDGRKAKLVNGQVILPEEGGSNGA